MCELFGISAKKEIKLNSLLREFYSHSEEHPHGWGLACMYGEEVFIEKEPIQALKSKYLTRRLTDDIEVKTAFAHIRLATIGNIEYKNCHPFTMKDKSNRRWTFMHNGTIFEYEPINQFAKVQHGDSDSERVLLYIISKLNEAIEEKGSMLSQEERFNIIDHITCDMAKGNKLNFMLYDGELFYVHTNYAGFLHFQKTDDYTIFSTKPLKKGEWEGVPFTTLLAYKEGEPVFTGTNHGNEYITSEADLKYLFQIFSGL